MRELQDWLNRECKERDLSYSAASRRAGVATNTISVIMNGQRPGLEVCKALARSFGVPAEHVLRMAGHLPAQVPTPLADIPLIQQFLYRLRQLPRDRQEHYMRMALMLFDLGGVDETAVLQHAPTADTDDD